MTVRRSGRAARARSGPDEAGPAAARIGGSVGRRARLTDRWAPAPNTGFDEVLAAARVGAEWALTSLYRDVHPGLVRYLHVHASGEEEDLAADVWLEVARGLGGFEGDAEGFRRFVFTIARRRAIDHGRRIARRRTDSADTSVLSERRGVDDTEDAVVSRLSGDEAATRVRALLPAEQAEVVLLRVVAGLSVSEVAAIVGRTPAAVSVIQHRALKRLAAELARAEPGDGG